MLAIPEAIRRYFNPVPSTFQAMLDAGVDPTVRMVRGQPFRPVIREQ
jgi:hypothetical protein